MAVAGIDLEVAEGEIYAFLGPNGAGKTTTVRMLTTLLQPDRRQRDAWPGFDVVERSGRRAPLDRRRAAGGRARPADDRARADAAPGDAARHPRARSRAARRRAARPRRPDGGRRPPRRHLLGRHAPPARPRHRARARPAGALPRRADDRPRPGQPRSRSGRRCASSTTRARPSSSRRSTSRRPTSSPTASGSSTTGSMAAEGTPAALKAQIGPPAPRGRDRRRRGPSEAAGRSSRASASRCPSRDGMLMVRLERRRRATSRRSCARSTTPGSAVESLELVEPTLDDVFVAKTGRHLEGADEDAAERGRRPRAPARAPSPARRGLARRDASRVVAALGRRSVMQAFRRPQFLAPIIVFPSLFLAVNTGGAGRAVDLPSFPPVHGFLDFQLAGRDAPVDDARRRQRRRSRSRSTSRSASSTGWSRRRSRARRSCSAGWRRPPCWASCRASGSSRSGLIFGAHIQGGVAGRPGRGAARRAERGRASGRSARRSRSSSGSAERRRRASSRSCS